MNQMPTSTASTVTEVAGTAVTTIPAIKLMSPKKIHQPRRSPSPGKRGHQRGQALHHPGHPDHQADQRHGQVQVPDQDHPDHHQQQPGDAQPYPVRLALSNTRTRWKIPEMTSTTPISTGMTFSDPLGCKLMISPKITVTIPTHTIACQPVDAANAGGSWGPGSSGCIATPSCRSGR